MTDERGIGPMAPVEAAEIAAGGSERPGAVTLPIAGAVLGAVLGALALAVAVRVDALVANPLDRPIPGRPAPRSSSDGPQA